MWWQLLGDLIFKVVVEYHQQQLDQAIKSIVVTLIGLALLTGFVCISYMIQLTETLNGVAEITNEHIVVFVGVILIALALFSRQGLLWSFLIGFCLINIISQTLIPVLHLLISSSNKNNNNRVFGIVLIFLGDPLFSRMISSSLLRSLIGLTLRFIWGIASTLDLTRRFALIVIQFVIIHEITDYPRNLHLLIWACTLPGQTFSWKSLIAICNQNIPSLDLINFLSFFRPIIYFSSAVFLSNLDELNLMILIVIVILITLGVINSYDLYLNYDQDSKTSRLARITGARWFLSGDINLLPKQTIDTIKPTPLFDQTIPAPEVKSPEPLDNKEEKSINDNSPQPNLSNLSNLCVIPPIPLEKVPYRTGTNNDCKSLIQCLQSTDAVICLVGWVSSGKSSIMKALLGMEYTDERIVVSAKSGSSTFPICAVLGETKHKGRIFLVDLPGLGAKLEGEQKSSDVTYLFDRLKELKKFLNICIFVVDRAYDEQLEALLVSLTTNFIQNDRLLFVHNDRNLLRREAQDLEDQWKLKLTAHLTNEYPFLRVVVRRNPQMTVEEFTKMKDDEFGIPPLKQAILDFVQAKENEIILENLSRRVQTEPVGVVAGGLVSFVGVGYLTSIPTMAGWGWLAGPVLGYTPLLGIGTIAAVPLAISIAGGVGVAVAIDYARKRWIIAAEKEKLNEKK